MSYNYEEIQKQFNQVLQASQDLPETPHTTKWFQTWESQKSWFLQSAGKLIYEMKEPVVFDLDEESRKSKVDEFIDWVYREYGDDMYQFFKCNYDGILENKLQQPYGEFPRGMKLSKVLMKEFGLDAEDVRQKLSIQ